MDIGHEQALIGAIINKPDLLVDIIGKIKPADFESNRAGIAFDGLLEMWQSQKGIDLVTVISHLGARADKMWVVSSTSVFTSSFMISEYVGMVAEKSSVRRIKQGLNTLVNNCDTSKAILSELAGIYDAEGGRESKESSIGATMTAFDEAVELAKANGSGVDTGFLVFQKNAIQYTPSQVWVVGGFTSVGKTAVLTEMLSRIDLTNTKSAVISTEMTTNQMLGRYLANKTGFSSNVILSGGLYARNQPKLDEAKAELKKSSLHIFDDLYELTDIEVALTKLSQQGGVDVVFLDYLQNCTVDGAKSEYQEMSILAKRIQKLAKKIKATIVCFSQVSNGAAKDDGGILQFKGAGEFSAIADVGIMLKKSKTAKRQIMLEIGKHRHGSRGRQVIEYAESWTKLEEIHHNDNE